MLRSGKRIRPAPASKEWVATESKKRYCPWKGHPATLIKSRFPKIPFADCPLPLPLEVLDRIDRLNEAQWINKSLGMWRHNARHNSRRWMKVKAELLDATKYLLMWPLDGVSINRPADVSWTITAPKRFPKLNAGYWWYDMLEINAEGELDYNMSLDR